MARHIMRLPDLGEGTVSAEVIAWKVAVGDVVREDAPLVEMATDKAVVEVPSPVSGRVLAISGVPGDVIAVGAELAVFELEEATAVAEVATPTPTSTPTSAPASALAPAVTVDVSAAISGAARVRTSPAVRRRAHEAGIDLTRVRGSGPGGRILASDLQQPVVQEIPLRGIRRMIAERMSAAMREAPHFSYVEEVDVTALEALRQRLNANSSLGLTYLPFIARALVNVLREFPQCNAHFDAERQMLLRYSAVHLGIATQTPDGLKVPVVRDAAGYDLAQLVEEIRRVTEAARSGKAPRALLVGSTITLTSLGKLGGIVSTPILNLPEVAIIGINKAVERVVAEDGKIAIRRMMNLSSSFDHRFVDGYDAAAMIQALKTQLEHPDRIFTE
jgi:2-oxoisovalerate dehydrogenase E2 component (dihydrolipoyl transacylase)